MSEKKCQWTFTEQVAVSFLESRGADVCPLPYVPDVVPGVRRAILAREGAAGSAPCLTVTLAVGEPADGEVDRAVALAEDVAREVEARFELTLEPVRADVAVIEVVDDDLLGLAYHRGVWLNGPARRALEESEAVCL